MNTQASKHKHVRRRRARRDLWDVLALLLPLLTSITLFMTIVMTNAESLVIHYHK